jgi:hypothetical protein
VCLLSYTPHAGKRGEERGGEEKGGEERGGDERV